MCQCHPAVVCSGCSHGFSRRGFLKQCGVGAAAGALTPLAVRAAEEGGHPKPRVALGLEIIQEA